MVVNPRYGTGDTPDGVAHPHNGTVKPDTGSPQHDEESPLLASPDSSAPKVKALTGVGTIIAVLLLGRIPYLVAHGMMLTIALGEFISNADATLVMAAAGRVSSEFNQLRDASWLSTGYTLGLCAAQPMVSPERHELLVGADGEPVREIE